MEAASTSCPNCYLGRTAIQKLLYFMNVLGVPMKYTFDVHHFGPFCADVMHDVDWLLADDVIQDCSTQERYSNYRPGSSWSELQQNFDDELEQHQPKNKKICAALCDLSPETLEQIATLDFSYRWVRARGGQGPWRQPVVEKFKSIKKDKFEDEEIDDWYQVLVDSELIEQ